MKKVFCVHCGSKNKYKDKICVKCKKKLNPKENLFKEYVINHIKDFFLGDIDGKITDFIHYNSKADSLKVHRMKSNEPYYLGVFLVGAYQEILGDMHNLFGDTNAVHISVDNDGYHIDKIIDGETIADVLDYVQYDARKLVRTLERWVTSAVKEGKISLEEGKEFLSNYRSGLYGYTYLDY